MVLEIFDLIIPVKKLSVLWDCEQIIVSHIFTALIQQINNILANSTTGVQNPGNQHHPAVKQQENKSGRGEKTSNQQTCRGILGKKIPRTERDETKD